MPETMSSPALAEALERAGIAFDVLPHDRTERATDEARVLGVRAGEVAKTVVVVTAEEHVRAVLPASERLDLHKLRDLVEGGKDVRLATEEELGRDYAEFELGAVPPLGGRADRVIVDRALAEQESVVLEAGTHEQSIRVETRELIAATGAVVADVRAD